MEHSHDQNHHEAAHSSHHKRLSWFTSKAHTLEMNLVPTFEKAPHLPNDWKGILVSIVPWVSIIFGILGLIGFLGAGSLGILFAPILLLSTGLKGLAVFVTLILSLVVSVLSILAFKPLQTKQKSGWDYSFYAFILSGVSSIISLVFLPGGLGGIVGALIGAYILFEIRERYN